MTKSLLLFPSCSVQWFNNESINIPCKKILLPTSHSTHKNIWIWRRKIFAMKFTKFCLNIVEKPEIAPSSILKFWTQIMCSKFKANKQKIFSFKIIKYKVSFRSEIPPKSSTSKVPGSDSFCQDFWEVQMDSFWLSSLRSKSRCHRIFQWCC